MAGMTDARKEVAESLREAGLTVSDHVPAKVVPPLVLVSTGDPMLEEAGTYDPTQFIYNLELFIIIGTKPNSEALTGLEEMVEKVIFNLGGWSITRVSPPEMRSANDALYLTVSLSIANTINIEGGN